MDFTTYEPRISALEAGGGGGGGDSDLSLAKVTIVNNSDSDVSWETCWAAEVEGQKSAESAIYITTGTNEYNIIMYGGYSRINTPSSAFFENDINTSGDVTGDYLTSSRRLTGFDVTGDGTITIK